MRVLVTGGTGHSGSHIIPELVAAGHEVTGPARSDMATLSALSARVRRARNVVEAAVIGLADRGVWSSVVRIADIAHGTTDRAGYFGFLANTAGAVGG